MGRPDPVCAMLGLAARGRNLVSGTFQTEQAIRENKARLLILTGDASDNTKKHFSDLCAFRKIPVYTFGTSELLGGALGKKDRVVAAVTDEGLARNIEEKLRGSDSGAVEETYESK